MADDEEADGTGAVDWDMPELLTALDKVAKLELKANQRILRFAIAGKHRRLYVVRTYDFVTPCLFRIEDHMFGYGSRNVAFKIAREKNAHVQILEFRKDFWKETKVESLLEALDFEKDA